MFRGAGIRRPISAQDQRLLLFRRLSAAYLAWSPGGYGWDCARHYEAPLAGTVPLMNYPTIVRHRPLRDGEHCILYAPEPGALARAVRSALADKERLLEMARAAQAHVREHHTLRARAEYVVTTALGRGLDGSSVEMEARAYSGQVPSTAER